ncbi:MAG TPA: YitT family protein [Clostridiales bacterium]|jgi:uncharacterized membrane-anchored protein YitT (DUF2179 family)|nr:YitT family protein [Clostridiales bacterium]
MFAWYRALTFRRQIKDYAKIVVGCLLAALSYPLFLVPNAIAPGGVTGLGTILHHLFGVPVGITSLALNVPLFVMGYRAMGKRFVFRTFVATIIFSLAIDLFSPLEPVTLNPLMASIFGGVLAGIGLGIILRGSATTGGSDMLARMLHNRFADISVSMFLFMFDGIVVLISAFTISMEAALYAMVAVYISARTIDVVLSGLESDKVCYVISSKYKEIANEIMTTMERGCTLLDGQGGYTGNPLKMLLCVVGRMEVTRLKTLVHDMDQDAFMFITDAHETLGEGFHRFNQEV